MKLWIKKEIIEGIFSDGNKWLPKETGGILMGYRSENESVITDLIYAGKKAIHGLYSFTPDQAHQRKQIAKIYEASKQSITYMGDWHTHPNADAYLSSTDKVTAHKISIFDKARLPQPIMLVAAPPTDIYKAWIYSNSGKKYLGTFTEPSIELF